MHLSSIDSFLQVLNKYGIVGSLSATESCTEAITVYCRNNPDGSVRWIWPSNSRHADFLRFYHIEGFSKRSVAVVVRFLFNAGMGKFFRNASFVFYMSPENRQIMEKTWTSRWALFTGTPGPNRKAVLWNKDPGKAIGCFAKIALSPRAEKNSMQEARVIQLLTKQQLPFIHLPVLRSESSSVLQLSDISKGTVRYNHFFQLPTAAVQSWLLHGLGKHTIAGSAPLPGLSRSLQSIAENPDPRIPSALLVQIGQLLQQVQQQPCLLTSFSHGDFTPWNIMARGRKIGMIDWELADPQKPALFDLFHFIYQSNCLIGNKGFAAIRKEINSLFAAPAWQCFARKYQINWQEAERQYLVFNLIQQLTIYKAQPQWHMQVQWLLKTWQDAVRWQLQQTGCISAREMLLDDLQQQLPAYGHALLKWTHGAALQLLPEEADIDICMPRQAALALLEWLAGHIMVKGMRISRQSHMFQVKIILISGQLVHLDLIYRLERKGLVFMDVEDLLAGALPAKNGLRFPLPEHDFAYVWMFYWLNGAEVPLHYQVWFNEMEHWKTARINHWIHFNGLKEVHDFKELWGKKEYYAPLLKRYLGALPANNLLKYCGRFISYAWNKVCNYRRQKGFVVTFSGVDGAGKSTVLNLVRLKVEKNLRERVVVLRHRPSILPILSSIRYGKKAAEQRAASILPRQGRNKNWLSSAFRFSYYYLDYLFGQFYIQLRYVWMGYVVLYDRYYFDMINDSERSNIKVPPKLVKWLYRLLVKPRLNFFLYAETKTILERKRELEPAVIGMLTQQYMQLFNKLDQGARHSRYIPVENENMLKTLHIVFDHIKKAAL